VGCRFAELITYLCSLNVFFFQVTDVIGDEGLRVVGRSCKMMRRLVVLHHDAGFITQHGLVGVAIGCHLLEKLIFYSADMNSEAIAILARNCPMLTDVRLCHVQKYHASYPVCSLLPETSPLFNWVSFNSFVHNILECATNIRKHSSVERGTFAVLFAFPAEVGDS
jgi:hypothetical protein